MHKFVPPDSDDNSSVQSSPWQRDHCWKQTTPRKHISAEMTLYFLRPAGSVLSAHLHKTARVCRRRPYFRITDLEDSTDAKPLATQDHQASPNDCPQDTTKLQDSKDERDVVDAGKPIENVSKDNIKDLNDQDEDIPKETHGDETPTKCVSIKVEKMETSTTEDADKSLEKSRRHSESMDFIDVETIKNEPFETQAKTSARPRFLVRRTKPRNTKCAKRRQLHDVLQLLIDRIPKDSNPATARGSGSMNHLTTATSRMSDAHNHQQHVSPRKRILRELEKVSLEDSQSMKRSRSKTNSSNHSYGVGTPPTVASRSPPNNIYSKSSAGSTVSNGNSTTNGSHLPAPIVQQPSRPISSYSITSLLGHNSSSSSSSNPSTFPQISSSISAQTPHPTESDYHRKTPSSPKSPAPNMHNHHHSFQPHSQAHSKPSSQAQHQPQPISAFSSAPRKKASPSSCLSPVISQNFARSPSLNSPINYGGRSRSPDLSPSPEQIYSRYRQAPYSIPSTTASSPNSSHYHHPYLTASRSSPSSGALSPPSASDATTTQHRYRYGSPAYSPQHQSQPLPPPAPSQSNNNNSSPVSFSPRYPQMSPQNYPPAKQQHLVTSPPYTSSSSATLAPRVRDTSPNGMPSRSDLSRESTASSSYSGSNAGNGTPRTVPKKSAALRNAYTSPASSPSHGDSNRNGDYMRASAKEDAMRKAMDANAAARPRSPTPAELQRHYEKELAHMHSLAAGGASLAELEAANANLIRAGLVPSSLQQHQHQQQAAAAAAAAAMAANMYRGMYMMPPSAAAAAAAGFLQPVYYPSMAFPGGAYRSPAWMHQPHQSPYAAAMQQHPHSRFAANPLLAAAAAYQQQQQHGGAGIVVPPPLTQQTSPSSHQQAQHSGSGVDHHALQQHQQQQLASNLHHHLAWPGSGTMARTAASMHGGGAQLGNDEPVSLVKNEPSSGKIGFYLKKIVNCQLINSFLCFFADVPLNLSKH